MSASNELASAPPDGVRARFKHAGFVPQTVKPPAQRLRGLAAAMAGIRNPIELWDEELFTLPCREISRFGQRFIEITEPELMHEVLVKQSAAFTRSEFQLRFTRPLVGEGILAARGDAWRLQRRAGAPTFRHCAVEELVPSINTAGERALARLADGKSSQDLVPITMGATFDIVTALLGLELGALDQAAIEKAADDYLKGVGLGAVAEIFGFGWLHRALPLEGKRAIAKMRAEAERAIALGCGQGARARLLAHLAETYASKAKDPLATLRDSVIAFIAAGNETSAVGLAWALYLIANDEQVQERLTEEARTVLGQGPLTADALERLSFHTCVIKEALRLFPPIALMQRTALAPVQVGGIHIKPGDEAICAIYVMHRSERVWPDASRFDPDRFAVGANPSGRHRLAFMPFGAGAHACLGMPLALAEMVGLLAMFTRALHFSPDPAKPVQPVMRLTLRPQAGVHLKMSWRTCVEEAASSAPRPSVLQQRSNALELV
jgi:cytochrome P450